MTFQKTPKQQEADGLLISGARHLLFYGGSRSGKTFHIVRAIVVRALGAANSRHMISRQHFNAVRASIWHDTFHKVMRIAFPGVAYKENQQLGYVQFANGSEIWFLGLDDEKRVEKVLAMEFATNYYGEISQMAYASVLIARTRAAQRVPIYIDAHGRPLHLPDGMLTRQIEARIARRTYLPLLHIYDCNPPRKQHWSYRLFFDKVDPITERPLSDPENYRALQMNPSDNSANLPPEYLIEQQNLPPAQRKRFWDGEFGAGVEGALWNWGMFKRVTRDKLPDMRRVIVGVDPPAKSYGAEAGIIIAGLGADARGYVLADHSVKGAPEQWAGAAVDAYRQFKADKIVGEVNNGGDMVGAVIRAVDHRVNFKSVHASRGKYVRAEPIAALYAENQVYHVGDFGDLENQLTELKPDFDPKEMGYSPDRADAMVWALSELMLGEDRSVSRARVSGT